MKWGRFITSLITEQVDYAHWRVRTHALKFLDRRGDLHVVHVGFITDFATIPPLDFIAGLVLCFSVPFSIFFAWFHQLNYLLATGAVDLAGFFVVLTAHQFNDNELLDAPATIHDEGYRRKRYGNWLTQLRMKLYWDRLFFEAMMSVRAMSKPPKLSWWKRTFGRPDTIPLWVAVSNYIAVSTIGWIAWLMKKEK
ncbi:MAG: hypothetical protein WCH99_08875 [Verrucomicrobiota bacterium]